MEFRKIVAMIPTYNEAENIQPLVEEVLGQDPRLEALVVDDDSPDGTWRIVEDMAAALPRVHLLRRQTRRGRGWAGIDGFKQALALGADAVIEMDGDYSHHPREIPALVEALSRCDLAVGSRAVPGGADHRPSRLRGLVTRLASSYVRLVLGVMVRDPTSGFRCFRRSLLLRLDLDGMRSRGPSTLEEVLLASHRLGARIEEVPIHFEDRHGGESKLSWQVLVQMLYLVPLIRLGKLGSGRRSAEGDQ